MDTKKNPQQQQKTNNPQQKTNNPQQRPNQQPTSKTPGKK